MALMSNQASDFSVTTPYGKVAGYPLNNGFHNGIDRAMPVGTPVVINGLLIGYSGNSGHVTGAHLHIGKFINGSSIDPDNSGFSLPSAYVWDTGYDDTNGHYVRIFSAGAVYVYLHLNQILVAKNQVVIGPAGGKGAGELTQGDTMPFIGDAELKDFQTWKDKGMYYENKLVPAMTADKIQWVKNFEIIRSELQTVQAQLTDEQAKKQVEKIIERCSIDISSLPPEDKTTVIGFIKSLFSRK